MTMVERPTCLRSAGLGRVGRQASCWWLLLCVACVPKSEDGTSSLSADTPVAQRMTDGTAIGDSTCMFERRVVHTEHQALVEEFVRRAAGGEFDRAESWLPSAVDCIGHEPGYDAFLLLDSLSTQLITASQDSALYLMRSRELGSLSVRLAETPGVRADTLRLYRTRFGWRLATPVFWNWMSPTAPRAAKWLDSLGVR